MFESCRGRLELRRFALTIVPRYRRPLMNRCPVWLACATMFLLLANRSQLRGASPVVQPIGINGFSGSESLLTFDNETDLADTLTVEGVKFTKLTQDGFIFVQAGRDPFFQNIPGASLGSAMRTTATLITDLLIELPTPANRFGLL